MDRWTFINKHINLSKKKVLEIGALSNPFVTSDIAEVDYLDHLDTEKLRKKYELDPHVDTEKLVSVKHVWSSGQFSDAVKNHKYDLIVASHVFEHLANPLQWLEDVKDTLNPGGYVFLALPDKRFTFDMGRKDTTLSEWIGAYIRKVYRPTVEQVFDHFSNVVEVSPIKAWRDLDYKPLKIHDSKFSMNVAKQAFETENYIDVHCSVFTPFSFLELTREAAAMGLFNYSITGIEPTLVDEFEFLTLLQSVDHPIRKGIDQQIERDIARQAGYQGDFGKGRFVLAQEMDASLRDRNQALIKEWRVAAENEFQEKVIDMAPILDPALHHERSSALDPRIQTNSTPRSWFDKIRQCFS